MKGTVFLIPNVLDRGQPAAVLSESVLNEIRRLRYFIYEEEKAARAFLARAGLRDILEELNWAQLSEHTPKGEVDHLLQPLLSGTDAGVISGAGCPGVADPGSDLVRKAHELGIGVKPLVGPSSLVLALMASGLNGQSFTFHGYLPIPKKERIRKIKEIEHKIIQSGKSHLFIETPYRNRQLLSDIVQNVQPRLSLCLAVDLTTSSEWIETLTIGEWKAQDPPIHKRPAVFIMGL